ncbi:MULTISPECIES: hypothetical protein [Sedimentibacter]|uniref:BhlA holin family protein n=1 Tax=Sedimentibacter hydroxybenzoicus DSM 7310 TaxID=1123245 RepID=A0A974BKD3_SEDHY|nr:MULTISPECIES: hypothetical protein [Sedimentibacter]NYB74471.1 hypothetical protein [Sedimentibacter hydroxybenzoicus DSM 7310]HCX61630.1 hypothetical protein [Clostridiales bacterium]
MDINNLIQNFGFPVSCVIGCGWFIYKMYFNSTEENKKREERNYEMLGRFQTSIDKFADVLEGYEQKLTVIERDVKDIKDVVNK